MPSKLKLVIMAISIASADAAMAAITVDVGNHFLDPGISGQSIEINVSTDTSDTIAGMNFLAEVVGPLSNPLISDVHFDSPGLLFFGNSDGYNQSFGDGTIEQGSITVAIPDSEIPAAGVIRVFFDTTSIAGIGNWSLRLTNVLDNSANSSSFIDSDGSIIDAIFTDGTIFVVPEPSSMVLMFMSALGAICWRSRGE